MQLDLLSGRQPLCVQKQAVSAVVFYDPTAILQGHDRMAMADIVAAQTDVGVFFADRDLCPAGDVVFDIRQMGIR